MTVTAVGDRREPSNPALTQTCHWHPQSSCPRLAQSAFSNMFSPGSYGQHGRLTIQQMAVTMLQANGGYLPTIRIDQEVYGWLQKRAMPFEDTPNSVLRRIANMDSTGSTKHEKIQSPSAKRRSRSASGKQLAIREGLNVQSAFYHHEGTWFHRLFEFPAALFDRYGYVVFQSQDDYLNHPQVGGDQHTNIPSEISTFPSYKKMNRPAY